MRMMVPKAHLVVESEPVRVFQQREGFQIHIATFIVQQIQKSPNFRWGLLLTLYENDGTEAGLE